MGGRTICIQRAFQNPMAKSLMKISRQFAFFPLGGWWEQRGNGDANVWQRANFGLQQEERKTKIRKEQRWLLRFRGSTLFTFLGQLSHYPSPTFRSVDRRSLGSCCRHTGRQARASRRSYRRVRIRFNESREFSVCATFFSKSHFLLNRQCLPLRLCPPKTR